MTYAAPRSRRPWRLLVVILLIVVPLAEIAAIIGVGQVIGGWPTLALLLFESALGAWIVRREGGAVWAALTGALRSGRMPAPELTDAALVLIGGTLLLSPGFLTDIVGFFFVLPFTRPITRRWFQAAVERRLLRDTGPRYGGHRVVPGEVRRDENGSDPRKG